MDHALPWRAAAAAALVLSAAGRADDLSPADLAAVERELQAASSQVDARHGNKATKDLSSEERREVILEQREATAKVLEKHDVDAKEYARRQLKLSREERAAVDEEKARLDREEAARKEATSKGSGEIEVLRGINDKHPVDVYTDPDQVQVESLQEEKDGPPPPPPKPPKPSKASKSHKPAHRHHH